MLFTKPEIALQRCAAGSGGGQQIIEDLNRNRIGICRVRQPRLKASRSRKEYAALYVPFVVRRKRMVESVIASKEARPRIFAYAAVGRVEKCTIARVRELNFVAIAIDHGAKLQIRTVDGGKHAVKLIQRIRGHGQ